MGKYKICVYAICKNESKFIDRWCKQFSDADLIIVGDTGSSDNSIELLKKNKVEVHEIVLDKFAFDDARNAVLDLIPEDVDICLTLDLDEIISDNWREILDKEWRHNTTRGEFTYNWTFLEDGTPSATFPFQRIHQRKDYRWKYPIHEVLEIQNGEEIRQFFPAITVRHQPDKQKSRAFYLDLLEDTVKKFPKEHRNYHYLGREYMYYSKHRECINMLKKYLAMPTATWNEERSASMRFIARSYIALDNRLEGKKWLLNAIGEAQHLREPLAEMALYAYKEQDWVSTFYYAYEASLITNKSLGYVHEDFAWNHTIYDLLAISSFWLEDYKKASHYNKLALELKPNDKRMQENQKLYDSKMQENKKE